MEDECPVCYEPNDTFLACAHGVCSACWAKIKDRRCPICRTVHPLTPPDVVIWNDSGGSLPLPPHRPWGHTQARLPIARLPLHMRPLDLTLQPDIPWDS